MTSKLARFCDGLLEAGWLAAIIAVPVFFNIHSERVFEPDKVAVLRSIAVLLFFTWLVRFVVQRKWQAWHRLRWQHEESVWRIPFLIPILALVGAYLLSTVFSVTPGISWAGSYQRLQGTYTTIAYVVFFLAAASTLHNRLQLNRIPTAVIVASIPVAFYGLLQHFGLDPLPWGGDVIVRVAGHMGNAIFIAAYLIMAVPLTMARIVDAFSNILGDETLSTADIVRSAVYVFALAIQLLAIYWSGSRGPMIGLATGLFSFVLVLLVSLRNTAVDAEKFGLKDVLWAFLIVLPPFVVLLLSGFVGNASSSAISFAAFAAAILLSLCLILLFVLIKRGWKWLWLSWLMLTVLLAGWLLLFNLPNSTLTQFAGVPLVGSPFESQLEWKELPKIGTYGRMLDPSQTVGREKSNRVRVLIWEGVVDLISPHSPLAFPDGSVDVFNFWRPLIGYGPESMYVAYNRFYPSELATVEARNASPDRSHNETFDALVITGLIGFLAWQALYLSVFYYGLDYLGIIRSRVDRYVFVGSWVGGALLGALLSVTLFDPIYLGVAIPTGTIVGIIGYLFYYAIFASSERSEEDEDPGVHSAFQSERLLVNALLAAILAHYVEVHFGIAIAPTRLYFFLFVALIFVIVYRRPPVQEPETPKLSSSKSRGAIKHTNFPPVWGPVLAWSFLLALLVGTLGYDFMNYVLPPDKTVASGADLRAGEIFNQALFVNPQQGFLPSPFVFLMLVISWALGVLIVLSEMIRQGTFAVELPGVTKVSPIRVKLAAVGFLLLGLLGLLQRFWSMPVQNPSFALARSLGLLGAVVCLWVAWTLVRDPRNGQIAGAAVSIGGIILAFLLLIAGGWLAAAMLAAVSFGMLLLLWDQALRPVLLPPAVLAILSVAVGMLYIYAQAVLLREALLFLIFLQGIEPISALHGFLFRPTETITSVQQARVWEARQSQHFLATYYIFLFSMILLAGFSLALRPIRLVRDKGFAVAYVLAAIAVILAGIIVIQTNLRPAQADMVFKRARPFDQQATQDQDPRAWDVAIAIYDEALQLAPWEDYYYLFLGRALLERSALATDEQERADLHARAEERLLEARRINPLNTDHSANLARLKTRVAVTSSNGDEQERLLSEAERYYRDALQLSPQNSVVRNELARLAFDLRRDCDQAINIFGQSLAIDPFYAETYFANADVLDACAVAQTDDSMRRSLYEAAITSLETGLGLEPKRARGWLQAGQIYQQLGRFDEALLALDTGRQIVEATGIPTWNVDYLAALVYRDMGDSVSARALADQALETAPDDISNQIRSFLNTLEP